MIRLVLFGVSLATTALAGYVAKRKFNAWLGEPANMHDPMRRYRPTTRRARNHRQPLPPFPNGDGTVIPLP